MTSHSPPPHLGIQRSKTSAVEGPEGHRGQGVEEADDALVTTLEPGTDLQTCWISQLPTDFKKTFLPSPPGGWRRDCSPEQLLRRSFHGSFGKNGKMQDVKNQWEESVWDRREVD